MAQRERGRRHPVLPVGIAQGAGYRAVARQPQPHDMESPLVQRAADGLQGVGCIREAMQHDRRAAGHRMTKLVRAIALGVERNSSGERTGAVAIKLTRPRSRRRRIDGLPQLGEESRLLREVLLKRARCLGGASLELVGQPHDMPRVEVGVPPPGLSREAHGDGGDDRRQACECPDQEPCRAWEGHGNVGRRGSRWVCQRTSLRGPRRLVVRVMVDRRRVHLQRTPRGSSCSSSNTGSSRMLLWVGGSPRENLESTVRLGRPLRQFTHCICFTAALTRSCRSRAPVVADAVRE